MSLVERLGFKTLSELYATLDNNEIMEWAAYDMLQNPDTLEKFKKEIDLEKQKYQSGEEETYRMKLLFMQIGNNT